MALLRNDDDDMDSSHDYGYQEKPKAASNFAPSMGNFSIQYNLSCGSIALAIMKSYQDTVVNDDDDTLTPDFPEPTWVKYTLLGLVFAGAVIGMTFMGYLGDILGRRRAMLITLGFTVGGALGAAILPWGTNDAIYGIICICRLFLGIGVGGIYPLSAAESAESTHAGEDSSERVGWAFFWQTPGSMAPYIVALILTQMNPSSWVTSFQFRLIMGLGALPAAAVFWHEYFYHRDSLVEFHKHHPTSPIQVAKNHPQHLKTLIGTGGGWFFYDIAYYGTAIFTPQILENIFGKGESLLALCWQSIVVTSIGLPACMLAIKLLPIKGARWLNIWGFLLIAVLFGALAIVYNVNSDGLHGLKFALFCLITFSLNWGPNVATYVLPAAAFPTEVRSTFHGLSAACAKLGAVAGTFMYQPIADQFGFGAVMWVQAALSLVGMFLSWKYISPNYTAEEHFVNPEYTGVQAAAIYPDPDD